MDSLSFYPVGFEAVFPGVSVEEVIEFVEHFVSDYGGKLRHLRVGNVDVYQLKTREGLSNE